MPVLSANERIGTTLGGKYALTRILGEGGMGVVFAGTHLHLGRPVAVKLLRPDLSNRKDALKRFLSEARTSAALRHPNVVDVLDIEQEDDGTVFMVQELLEGCSFSTVLEARKRLPLDEAFFVLRPVMQALIVAHDARIVHRDLKPDNIFLHRGTPPQSGAGITPKVLDFGIAKLMEAQGHDTQTGVVLGTPRYMSPEQAQAREFGPWYDVWALAVIWFETLTGVHPLALDSRVPAASMMARIITETPQKLRTVAPEIPRAISDCIDSALRKDPARRPDIRAFERGLAEAFAEAGISPRTVDLSTTVSTPSLPTMIDGASEPAGVPGSTPSGMERARAARRALVLWVALALAGLGGLATTAWIYGGQSGPVLETRPLPPPSVAPPSVAPPSVAPPPMSAPPSSLALPPPIPVPTTTAVAPPIPATTIAPHRPPHSTPHRPAGDTATHDHDDTEPEAVELGTNGIPI